MHKVLPTAPLRTALSHTTIQWCLTAEVGKQGRFYVHLHQKLVQGADYPPPGEQYALTCNCLLVVDGKVIKKTHFYGRDKFGIGFSIYNKVAEAPNTIMVRPPVQTLRLS